MWVGRAGNVLPAAVGHGVSFSIAVEFGKLELILMRFSEFKGERSAFRMPPQAAYEGFPLSAKSIPISVEADAAEDEAAPRESERALEVGDVGDGVRSWSNGVSTACLERPIPRGMGVSRRQVC